MKNTRAVHRVTHRTMHADKRGNQRRILRLNLEIVRPCSAPRCTTGGPTTTNEAFTTPHGPIVKRIIGSARCVVSVGHQGRRPPFDAIPVVVMLGRDDLSTPLNEQQPATRSVAATEFRVRPRSSSGRVAGMFTPSIAGRGRIMCAIAHGAGYAGSPPFFNGSVGRRRVVFPGVPEKSARAHFIHAVALGRIQPISACCAASVGCGPTAPS